MMRFEQADLGGKGFAVGHTERIYHLRFLMRVVFTPLIPAFSRLREKGLKADQFAPGDPLRDGGVVHADDDDAVISEQFALDGFAERQGIQHFAKQGGVVHADHFDAAIFGGFMHGAGVGARGGGGEQALGAAYLGVVEDGGEVAADLARATVGFVRHGQVEGGDGRVGLGGGDDER